MPAGPERSHAREAESIRAPVPPPTIDGNDPEVFEVVYRELRAIAGRYFATERRGHTLQPTALVHEAWVRLAPHVGAAWSENRLKAAASTVMRRVLVDHARRVRADKRGGDAARVPMAVADAGITASHDVIELAALDDALDRLASTHPRQASVVQFRFFGGLEEAAIAEVIGVSLSTVQADWRFARAWIRQEMTDGRGGN